VTATATPSRQRHGQFLRIACEDAPGLPQDRGSGRDRRLRVFIVGWVEFLSEAGAERAIVDGAANLEQKIGPSAQPVHLLRFVHPAVHQKIGRPLGDRGGR
jgi:hypothetical protein